MGATARSVSQPRPAEQDVVSGLGVLTIDGVQDFNPEDVCVRAEGAPGQAASRSREHKILEEDGLLIIVGGKYTTYRTMAREAVDRICRSLKKQNAVCTTDRTPLPGSPEEPFEEFLEHEKNDIEKKYKLSRPTARRLVETYGIKSRDVLAHLRDDPSLGRTLCPHTDLLGTEVLYAVTREHAQTADDVLFRRTWLGYGPCRGADALESIERILSHGSPQ